MTRKRSGVRQISEIANGMLDPVLARRAGINTLLLGSWDEIAGETFAECSRPERIAWDRRRSVGDDMGANFTPGVLTVACDGARALYLMHAKDELIQRINAFFGFPAVDRLRIVQKPVSAGPPARRLPRTLSPHQNDKLDHLLDTVDDPKIKASLEKLGRAVLAGRILP